MKTIPEPVIKENQENSELISAAKEFILAIENKEHEDPMENYKNTVFEAAIEMIFGTDVWKWINKNLQ